MASILRKKCNRRRRKCHKQASPFGYCCVIETQRLISNNVDTEKNVKLRKTYQNTEGQNGKFPLNIISAIYVFKMISYLKYCFFVTRGNCKTFLYMQH